MSPLLGDSFYSSIQFVTGPVTFQVSAPYQRELRCKFPFLVIHCSIHNPYTLCLNIVPTFKLSNFVKR